MADLQSNALTSLAAVKTFLGISNSTHDALLTDLLNAASDFVEQEVGYDLNKQAYSNQLYDGNGSDKLTLREGPVDSSASFTLERRDSSLNEDVWQTINAKDYFVDYNAGMIIKAGGSADEFLPKVIFGIGSRNYRISYTAGYATIPFHLQNVVWKLVKKEFKTRTTPQGVSQVRVGDTSVTFMAVHAYADEEILSVINRYKRFTGI